MLISTWQLGIKKDQTDAVRVNGQGAVKGLEPLVKTARGRRHVTRSKTKGTIAIPASVIFNLATVKGP